MTRQSTLVDPDWPAQVNAKVPGWLKNEIVTHCKENGVGLNAWIVEALRKGLRDDLGLPEPPPARAPLPTVADQIREWAVGERIVTPCGRIKECPATQGETWEHGGMTFCRDCGIRVI
jgi:hypothetical protein